MKLLVTTSYSVLEVDTGSAEVRSVHRGDGLYYGISQSDKNIYVAARKRMVSSDVPIEEECGEILIFDFDLRLKGRLCAPFPLRDLHQIAWHAGKLWLTCSYDNLIAIWDGVNWQKWFPMDEKPDAPRDIHHYNSFMFNEEFVWILAHNRGPSELLAFSLADFSLKRRIQLGDQAHNIWSESGKLYTCSSKTGMIMGQNGFSLCTGGFPRGYAFDGVERCIGISELAERKDRDPSTGKLLVYDSSWNLMRSIVLAGEGLVLDMFNLDRRSQRYSSWLQTLRRLRFFRMNVS